MEGDVEGIQCTERAPSRAGHRPSRPPMKRSNACYNAFPDLPPIRNSPTPPLDTSSSTDSGSSSSSGSDSDDEFKVDLTPLCPPSPPSPTSPCSESSSDSLFSPLDQEDWERFHDGFAPPAIHGPHSACWPSTPPPRLEFPRILRSYAHYGWSNNALYEMKAALWYRRQWAWWHYEEHCRYLAGIRTDATDDGIPATIFYPPPPALLPSRRMPWMSANGLPLPTAQRIRAQPQPAADAAWKANCEYFKPIYPRFGDIADLRDPSCEEADRRYYAVPAFKLQQFVYVSEMDALRGRPRRAANLVPPSPLARCWTPDSPASVYSQDGAAVASPLTEMAVTFPGGLDPSSALHPIMTEWRFRWGMINRLFPSPPPPPLHAHPYLPHWFPPSPVAPPPRPGTPLPDELSPTHTMDVVSATELSVHGDEDPVVDTTIVSVAPAPLSEDTSYTEISVHLSAPLPVQCPVDVPARPPTPSVRRGSESIAQGTSVDPEPVVRLPSPSPSRATVPMVSPLAVSSNSRPTVSTLAQELERAVTDSEESSSVRCSVQLPPSRPESPRFCFIAYDTEDLFADEYAVEAEEDYGNPGQGLHG
ncbi:hypothetical protein L226DRAFT_613950 [Lentinus tigrinus ALCF2SS1-7]|uniref:Uncharacterized protein n=1 Tax=Lentinus tigrinus ALCF2SS1-6 TaxID=1328759 RepID=A0A5C2RSC9_9APHY|nr:hypothetical protein L227DRAFT_604236 [Lentinus tigrinus ALCF2SS1-6]RPD73844.1 hypothetical protein L226DRAFT_613950 [Lentinus tigrinus ALCF2SS1-7]